MDGNANQPQAQQQPQGQTGVQPEAHEAVKAAFAGPHVPTPHFESATVSPAAWQALVSMFGPMLVSLIQAVIARIGGGGQPPAPTPAP